MFVIPCPWTIDKIQSKIQSKYFHLIGLQIWIKREWQNQLWIAEAKFQSRHIIDCSGAGKIHWIFNKRKREINDKCVCGRFSEVDENVWIFDTIWQTIHHEFDGYFEYFPLFSIGIRSISLAEWISLRKKTTKRKTNEFKTKSE